jgi:hypothetical protein
VLGMIGLQELGKADKFSNMVTLILHIKHQILKKLLKFWRNLKMKTKKK